MGHPAVKYWMHNNMLTINGQKMGKSYNNFITLEQFFTGQHPLLEKAYSPMTIRFFILSAHYRGTVDFSNEALLAAEKGLEKLQNAIADLQRIAVSPQCDPETEKVVKTLRQRCYDAMNDDLATPQLISILFEASTVVNKLTDHKATICADCLKELSEVMHLFAEDILGLTTAKDMGNGAAAREEAFGHVVDMVLALRAKAKAAKDWATSDQIRDELAAAGFEVKDTKDGVTWKLNR
jgi:cysteinyl-tRNA synthetase